MSSTLLLRNKNDPFLERIVTCDEKRLDAGEAPQHFPSRNCTKKGYRDCLVVCGRSHPSQLFESGRNGYGGEVLPTNWRKCTRSSNICARDWSIWRDQFLSMTMLASMLLNWPCRSWMNLATRLCFIRHIHRTSRPPIITFQASRQLPARKMLQKPRWCRIGLQWLHRFQNSRFLC